MKSLLAVLICYLLGSVSVGILITRIFGQMDIRTRGSGNPGATNILRVMGKKFGLLTFVLDVGKGALASFIGLQVLGSVTGGLLCGFAAVLGHNFPLYFGFRGGKGVATTFGAVLCIYPIQMLLAFSVFLVIVALTHYVSLGSIIAAISVSAFILPFTLREDNLLSSGLILAYSLLAILRHRSNILRLLHHEENKVSFKRKEKHQR